MARGAIALGIMGVGIALGLYSLDIARDAHGQWFAGTSTATSAAFLVAGWSLIACGVFSGARNRGNHLALLLTTAGFAWFLLEWNNPGIGSALAFTTGLALYAACPPLVTHAVLGYPAGRLGSGLERIVLAVGYGGNLVLLGLLPALLLDPRANGCTQCPDNLLSVTDRPEAADDVIRVGVYIGFAWAAAAGVFAIVRLAGSSSAAWRAAGPVHAAGAAYAALVAAWFAASFESGYVASGTLERRLWLAQVVALAGVAAGVFWNWARAHRARAAVAHVVIDLVRSPPPGGLRDVLAGIVGDPGLVLAYPVGQADALVDAHGRPVEPPESAARTSLVSGGRIVAVLAHRPGLLDDEQLVHEVTAAARLALENERLQAEVQARLEELRGSRARIVAAGDAERKRLERDLHDGAQQRLVGLALSVRLVRSQFGPDACQQTIAGLEEAEAELRLATAELRELAHGIFPAVLADEGLSAAVEALAEEARVPIRIRELPGGRFAPAVETAAYTVVLEAARAADGPLSVSAERSNGTLVVEVETGECPLDVVELQDRIGALDGRIGFEQVDGRSTIRAELPCGS